MSAGISDWFYNDWTSHFTGKYCPQLIDRIQYKSYVIESRINLLNIKIKKHKPKLIVFSGAQYNNYYNSIIGLNDNDWEAKIFDGFNCWFKFLDKTLLVKVVAPNTRGLTKEYWNSVSNKIKAELERKVPTKYITN